MRCTWGRKRATRSALVLCALIVVQSAWGEPHVPPLFGAVSPRIAPSDRIELSAVGGHEWGAIPDSFGDLSAGFTAWGRVGIEAGAVAVHVPRRDEYRLAEVHGTFTLRLLSRNRLLLSPYGRAALHIGDEIVEDYTGDLDDVSAAVSPRAAGGYDLSGGLSAAIGLPNIADKQATLVAHAAYDYTGGRDVTATGLEEERRRISVAATPTVILTDPERRPRLTFGWTHAALYWFDRGYLYDMMPQFTFEVTDSIALNAGASIPVVGGLVWRLFAGLHVSVGRPQEIRIVIENLHFPPNSADMFGFVNPAPVNRNREIIADLYRRIQRFRRYSITVEGHTSFVYWNDPVRGPREEREVLFPLSQARAEAVQRALIELGIEANRITAEGRGPTEPIVPFGDTDNQWRNRRVEIVLRRR